MKPASREQLLERVLRYHEQTKHHLHRHAASLGYLDWDTQPDPFRRYEGAEVLPLDEVPPAAEPTYGALFDPLARAPAPLDRRSVAQLLYDSLALSAWKEIGAARWSLRVNPSSGNLHPTEGYLLAGPIAGLLDEPALCHYSPHEHALEVRARIAAGPWAALAALLPPGALLLGLTSIHWREAWKYGERAFRYCQQDAGHALGAVAIAASALGWETHLLAGVTDPEIATLLGVSRQTGMEAEHPDCLLAIHPAQRPGSATSAAGATGAPSLVAAAEGSPLDRQSSFRVPRQLLAALAGAKLAGRENRLSRDHHEWAIIPDVAAATALHEPPATGFWKPAPPVPRRHVTATLPGRAIIRQRRSAVAMDGKTSISRDDFYAMLSAVSAGAVPFSALPWKPSVHLALFVHRVDDLPPGLYFLLRDPAQGEQIRKHFRPELGWTRPDACPAELELRCLVETECRGAAATVSCRQEIAADGAFAGGMIAELEPGLREHGPWFYRHLHWEAGAIGQVLYLEAEAALVSATGIGCFFDDAMHEILGIRDRSLQTIYHFTVGGRVDDTRLRTAPPYAHRALSGGTGPMSDDAREDRSTRA